MFGKKNKKTAFDLAVGDVIEVAGVELTVVENEPNSFGRALRQIRLDPDTNSTVPTWERQSALYIPSHQMVTFK